MILKDLKASVDLNGSLQRCVLISRSMDSFIYTRERELSLTLSIQYPPNLSFNISVAFSLQANYTDRPSCHRLSALVPNVARRKVSLGQRNGSARPLISQFSRPEPLLFSFK
jgi:hypothetical protein